MFHYESVIGRSCRYLPRRHPSWTLVVLTNEKVNVVLPKKFTVARYCGDKELRIGSDSRSCWEVRFPTCGWHSSLETSSVCQVGDGDHPQVGSRELVTLQSTVAAGWIVRVKISPLFAIHTHQWGLAIVSLRECDWKVVQVPTPKAP